MLQLINGCSCSEPSVHPSGWRKVSASVKRKWYVQYYFYDPVLKPKGKLIIVKGGINKFKTVIERREAAKIILNEIINQLKEGYNPINKTYTVEIDNDLDIFPLMPWVTALEKIKEKFRLEPSTVVDMKWCMKKIVKASTELRYQYIGIGEIKRRHIKLVLEQMNLSAHGYNKARSYLLMMFKELLELDVVDVNPIRDISKRKTIRKIRKVLTVTERRKVNDHLYEKHYPFWRFMLIFFHSGARINEMLALKVKEVDLPEQRFKVLVKKGRQQAESYRVIKSIALPLWEEVLQNSNPEDYVFSSGLKPGIQHIRREQITRRWYVHVKKKLGITADFYSLKHLNLDETSKVLDIEAAATMAGHTSIAITMRHYAFGEKEREMERLKKINNKFA